MDTEKTIRALEHNHYRVTYFATAEEATAYLDREINGKTVGFGDSQTMISMRLFERLSTHNTVHDPAQSKSLEEFFEISKRALTTEVYLTSVNALSETGEMVNIDGGGNRLAGSLFGHERVFFVAGVNKIAPDLPAAIERARHHAGPMNAKKYELSTPCVQYGNKMGRYEKCFDCDHPDRICNAMVIYMKKMEEVDAEVVLINESLGY